MDKSVDSFRMSAELMRDKEITMLREENAALKAQVNEFKHAHEQRLITMTNDEVADVFAKSPQACLSEHNAKIEEEVIERCRKFVVFNRAFRSLTVAGKLVSMPRKYTGDK